MNKNKNKYLSRNRNFSLKKYNATTYSTNNTKGNFLKSFNPCSTFNNIYQRSSSRLYNKQCKVTKKELNNFVNNLNEKTKLCNNKLIKLINSNRKINLRKKEERNKEIINLKRIILDNKNEKPKKKINNIKEIKSLINKAKMDIDGELVNELFTKRELKEKGKNFTQDELQKLKKKKEKQLIVEHNRKKIKDNYNLMIKLENDLTDIKRKFNKTNINTMIKNNDFFYSIDNEI